MMPKRDNVYTVWKTIDARPSTYTHSLTHWLAVAVAVVVVVSLIDSSHASFLSSTPLSRITNQPN